MHTEPGRGWPAWGRAAFCITKCSVVLYYKRFNLAANEYKWIVKPEDIVLQINTIKNQMSC